MQKAYKLSILYFLLFTLLLLVSSVMIFEQKIGLSPSALLTYYQGDENSFIVAKSHMGTLKIILPHIFAFGLFSMVLLHFVAFTKHKHGMAILIYSTFFIAFCELASPFFIIAGFESFAYVKLFSFVIFELLILYILWILFVSIVYD